MKTHRSLTLLSCLLLPLLAAAGPVTEQQALLKAQQFMQGKTFTAQKSRRLAPRQDSNTAAFYVFNAQEGGYAVVSGDDRTPAILGYSQEGRLDMDVLPEHIQSWLDGYAEQIAYLQEHPDARIVRKVVTGTAIAPLLGETEWGQGTPYNDLCPIYNNEHCLTGCVATAMAQVMYYHKWPKQTTKEIPGYTTKTLNLNIDNIPIGTIEWNNMLPEYSQFGTDEQLKKQAVASLIHKCGVAVKMDYGITASTGHISEATSALKDYFDYDSYTTICIKHADYGLERWNQLIYNELTQQRPVLYGGQSVRYGGHAFVVDGYDKDDYFHINWGWNGDKNGYFLLTVLDPYDKTNTSNEGFSDNQEAIVGIQKTTGIIPEEPATGEIIKELTPEGIEMTFKVISAEERICQVGEGRAGTPAIDMNTEGCITIPSQVKGYKVVSLGTSALALCRKITKITLPETIETIGSSSFSECSMLTEIHIPSNVTNIADGALSAPNLQQIVVDEDNRAFKSQDGVLVSKNGQSLHCFPAGREGEFAIPSNILYLRTFAFENCNLTKITLPNTIKKVETNFASFSKNLSTVIWNTTAALPGLAFQNCPMLSNVELSEGITSIPSMFITKACIKEIKIPSSVQSIKVDAFRDCKQLEKVSFSTRVSTIGSKAFYTNNNLKEIIISYHSQGLFNTTLPEDAFANETYLSATLYVPTGSASFFAATDGWKQFQHVVEYGEAIPDPGQQEGEGDIWGDYAANEYNFWLVQSSPMGGTPDNYEAALFIPGDEMLIGSKITAIRVPSNEESISAMEQGTVWLAESLGDATKTRVLPMHDLDISHYKEYVLSEPYTITEKGIYVGYTVPGNPVMNYWRDTEEGYYHYRRNKAGSWKQEYGNYHLPLQIRVSNHHIPSTAAHFSETTQPFTYPQESSMFVISLFNEGTEKINSIDYTVNVKGKTESRHLDIELFSGRNQHCKTNIEITGPEEPNQYYSVSITIDKVNGKANTSPNKTITQQFMNLGKRVVRRTVMEELTGTWCTWCPRGMVAMKLAKEKYGDRFIGIAIHNSYSTTSGIDPMDIKSYPISFSQLPACMIDRTDNFLDPYNDTFGSDGINLIDAALQVSTNVDVTVKGVWNEDKTQVIATSETEFLSGGDGFSVAYVLVADGVKHSGSAWYQANGFSHITSYSSDPNLKPYVEAPNPMTDVTYNDVMIASSYNGYVNQAASYVGNFVAGEKKKNRYILSLPTTGELAEAINQDQIYVVAIVLNADGTIANEKWK